jgi:hypothetical protein
VGLPQSPKTELQYCFLERRLRPNGRAPAHVYGGREQHKVNEVSARNWQVGNILRVNHLADFGFLRIHALRRLLDLDRFPGSLDLQRYRNGRILSHGQGKRALIRAELIRLHGHLITAGRQAGSDRDSHRARDITSFCTGFQVSEGDSRSRDNAPRWVCDGNVQRG